MISKLVTGPQDASGIVTARAGQNGDQIVSQLHGKYYEQAVRQKMFGVTGSLTTTTAEGAATFTGLVVGNPAGSGVNLAVQKIVIAQPVALTAETELGIFFGPATAPITASITPYNLYAGGAGSVCTANAGQTITAVTARSAFVILGAGGTAVGLDIRADLEGSLIIPPGYFFASYTSRVTTTALVFRFQWEEVPIL